MASWVRPAIAGLIVLLIPASAAAASDIRDMVTQAAREQGVPVELAHAVVQVESNYRPDVTGSAGEIGLMQIKLSTARLLGYRGSSKRLYDPAVNLRYGMRYLRRARELAGGDLCGTVAKYQGGHATRGVPKMSRIYCGKVKRFIALAASEEVASVN